MSKPRIFSNHQYTKSQINKLNNGICVERCCRNEVAKSRHICHYHRGVRWRLANPAKYAYIVWRSNCIRRGKKFEVTYDQFLFLLKKYNYLELKGTGPLDLCFDRRENELGYTVDNIRGITMSANSFKRNYHDYKTGKRLTYEEARELAGTPF